MSVTFTRSGVAYQRNGSGVWVQVSDGVARTDHFVDGQPFSRYDPARTQRFLNSGTPATQTISIPAGTYTLWVEGSGSIALSGGPTGTATAGSPVTFTLGGTTSVTFTVSGSLTLAQVENGRAPTTYIPATGANATRNQERVSITLGSSVVQSMTLYADLYEMGDLGAGNEGIFHVGAVAGTAPFWRVETGTTPNTLRARLNDGTTAQNTPGTAETFHFDDHIEVLAWIDTVSASKRHYLQIIKNGVAGAVVQSPAFTMPANFSEARLGLGSNDLAAGLSFSTRGVSLVNGIQTLDTMRLLAGPLVNVSGSGAATKTLAPTADGVASSSGCTPSLPLHRNHKQARREVRCRRSRCCQS